MKKLFGFLALWFALTQSVSYLTAQTTFTNSASIAIPGTGTGSGTAPHSPASPYPSDISVTGLTGLTTKVTVTLNNIQHTFANDIDMLLVAPTGQTFMLLADVGGNAGFDVASTVTLDDAGASAMPTTSTAISGTYRPTSTDAATAFPASAPALPYASPAPIGTATFASVFNGLNPNGTWSLYIRDDAGGDIGTISGGWSITITSVVPTTDDVGVSAVTAPANASTVYAGSSTDVVATVNNFGTAAQGTVPVFYRVNGGAAVGPVNVAVAAGVGSTATATFTGGNAFTPGSAGSYTLKVYTALGGDIAATNDTTTITVEAITPISAYPYAEGFESAVFPPQGYTSTNWGRITTSEFGTYAAGAAFLPAGTKTLTSRRFNLPVGQSVKFFWRNNDPAFGRGVGSGSRQLEKAEKDGKRQARGGGLKGGKGGNRIQIEGFDTTYFEISTDGGAGWTTLGFLSPAAPDADYSQFGPTDLSAYAGGNTVLRWRYVTDGTFFAYGTMLDSITVFDPASAPPDAASTPIPVNGTITVSPATGLGWNNGAVAITNTKVYFGTSPTPITGGTLVYDGAAATSVTNAQLGGALAFETTYYWQVVSTNLSGPTNSAVFSFTTAFAPLAAYPYTEDFEGTVPGWTVAAPLVGGTLWALSSGITQPDGSAGISARANFFSVGVGAIQELRTRPFNFAAGSKPVLEFSLTHRSYTVATPENDGLQIYISTDGGETFPALGSPTNRVYDKEFISTPSLSTQPPTDDGSFTSPSYGSVGLPVATSHWRHETIDLSAYAGQPNVVVAFRARSDFGNNLFIDNVSLTTTAAQVQTSVVTGAGAVVAPGGLTINFADAGTAPATLNVNYYNAAAPPTLASPVYLTNSGATTQDGSVFTPNTVAQRWWALSYSGQDYNAAALSFSISIDLSTLGGTPQPSKLYVLKRADRKSPWEALTTTLTGNILTAAGQSRFSDLVVGGNNADNPLPVELVAFTAAPAGEAMRVAWKTASEINNTGFELWRKTFGESGVPESEFVMIADYNTAPELRGQGTKTGETDYAYRDAAGVSVGKSYLYKLIDVSNSGVRNEHVLTAPVKFEGAAGAAVPTEYALYQNYPNPFNPATTIRYDLKAQSRVRIELYDVLGKRVAVLLDAAQAAGAYRLAFDARSVSSGSYFYRITAEAGGQAFSKVMKMTLLK